VDTTKTGRYVGCHSRELVIVGPCGRSRNSSAATELTRDPLSLPRCRELLSFTKRHNPPPGVHDQMSVVSKRNTFNTDDPLCYVRVVMDGKKRGRIFWLALVGYAVWLTIVLRHAISNNKPVGSLLVLSIVPPLVVVLLWRQGEKWRAKKP